MAWGSWEQWGQLLERLKPSNFIPYHELRWSVLEESGIPDEAIENLPPKLTRVETRGGEAILLVDKEGLEKWLVENIPQPQVEVSWYAKMIRGMGRG